MKFTVAKGYKSSPMEKKVEQCLLERGICFYREVMFSQLVNPETGCKLRYDFFIESLNLLIEYDGKSYHKSPDVIKRDEIKNKYAKSHKITLVRITGGQKGINSFIKEYLSNYTVSPEYKIKITLKYKKEPKSKHEKILRKNKKAKSKYEERFKPVKSKNTWKEIKKKRRVHLGVVTPAGMTETEYRQKIIERNKLIEEMESQRQVIPM